MIECWDSPRTYDLLVERVLHSEAMRPWLASTHTLSITDPSSSPPTSPESLTGKNFRLGQRVYRFAQEFAGSMPNLSALYLDWADWIDYPPHPNMYTTLSQFPSVRSLRLNVAFRTLGPLCRVLHALPSLRDLDLHLWVGAVDVSMPVVYPHARPALETLNLRWIPSEHGGAHALRFAQWLSMTPTPSSLRELHLVPSSCGGDIFSDSPFFPWFATGLFSLELVLDLPERSKFFVYISSVLC